ncbi:MAG TPA: pyrroline-5-carboxylate reductase [Thermoanaerobaculia bacterium]|jgi:pyrroline-5-carboxylate reductase
MNDIHIDSLAVIGAGKMGTVLISALTRSGVVDPERVIATAKTPERRAYVEREYGVRTIHDNREAARGAEVVLLAVKPQIAPQVLAELGEVMTPEKLLLSIVAGLTTAEMEKDLGGDSAHAPRGGEVPVVRTMPNTPSRIGCGMTAVCGGRWAQARHVELARDVFARLGRSLVLDEHHFDAVTGLSASGPAFLYVIIESLAEGGVKVGLPRTVATELAAQTCLGAAQMVLETGDHPAMLKDEVTTPAGCTIDGLLKLEEGGLRVTLIKAVVEASNRAAGLVGS